MEEEASVNLGRIVAQRKTGSENFHQNGASLGFTLLDFWRWSTSDLVSNATRGRLAEFIVANALGISTAGVRDEWSPVDLITPEVKVEVKSGAYIQSWHQTKLSTITFRTPKTRAFNPDTNQHAPEAKRQADVYVFAILAHKEKNTVDPLDVNQWEFYAVPTVTLDRRKRSQFGITLPSLIDLVKRAEAIGPVQYRDLKEAVLQSRNLLSTFLRNP